MANYVDKKAKTVHNIVGLEKPRPPTPSGREKRAEKN